MSRYTDLGALKEYLGIGTDAGTDGDWLLQQSIERAERAIDNYTRRTFVGTPGTVYYSRFYQTHLRGNDFYLDQDLHTLVSLTLGDGRTVPVDGTVPGSGSVWTEPRNAGPPYRVLRLKSAIGAYTWNTDQDMVVAGTWGFSTVAPDDIVQATTRYAAYLYRQKDVTPNDQIGYAEGPGVQPMGRGMPDDVRYLLSPYRSRTGGVV